MSAATSSFVITPSSRLQSRFRTKASHSIGPDSQEETVGRHLLDFLGIPGLQYRERPAPLGNGWEMFTYGLTITPHPALPEMLCQPLVLRIFTGNRSALRARHEFAIQTFIYAQGFPAPRPLLLVEDDEVFGGPFVLMERLLGRPLMETLREQPWRLWDLPGRMAELHVQLHQLPTERFPALDGDFLDRSLDKIRARISAYNLDGLQPGLDWLMAHRPEQTEPPCILHLDWHPLNVMHDGNTLFALDWTEADIGDRHADVAATLMTLHCLPSPPLPRWQWPFVPTVRGVIARRYLRAYQRRLPIDEKRLTYYSARATLSRLAHYGCWLSAGPGSTGSRPSALRYASPANCATLCRYFTQHTGVDVWLGWEEW